MRYPHSFRTRSVPERVRAIYRGRYCDGNAIFTTFNWSDAPEEPAIERLIVDVVRSANAAPPSSLVDQCQNVTRPHVLQCGQTATEIEVVGGGLPVVIGCQPAAQTQAMFVTRSGTANVNAPNLRSYLNGGGIVIGEFSNSDELFNAAFGTAVVQGAQTGRCQDNVMPAIQHSPNDSFWQENRFAATATPATGCGNDLSAFPGIRALGGHTAGAVHLAWRDLGRGRLWLAESDWSDGDSVSTQTLGLLRYMAQHNASGAREGRLVEGGVAANRPVAQYLKSGFTRCATSSYDTRAAADQWYPRCTGEVVVMACGLRGGETLVVSAMGARNEVLRSFENAADWINVHNGVTWFFTPSQGIGLAPADLPVFPTRCMDGSVSSEERLCVPTFDGRFVPSSGRCGVTVTNRVEVNRLYDVFLLQRNGDAPN